MSQNWNADYATLAKRGFTLGAGLFLFGIAGEVAGSAVLGTLPAWGDTLLVDIEMLGILLGLLSPLVFGVVMPLTE
ncbi:DUF7860 family protein [Haloarcula argentinensis]|uniref:MFS transporter n=1 Tax=Haloarcula argentinensis TaxID=43776 RepID=A0ABU2EXB6_HALAR|nr:hypothetical protein [Haloarcula argentinensis]EMA22214.1 hypothetical protein C443_09667 [Haloarcula argentinensis DSM 12282]MDS0252476.1 hypothetical protein [Haloarcula argentinensis]